MNTDYVVNTDPKTWPAEPSEQRLKPEFGGGPLIDVTYGTFHGKDERHDLTMLIRASIYEELLSGEYEVSPESNRLRRLIIVNKNGRVVKPLASTIY